MKTFLSNKLGWLTLFCFSLAYAAEPAKDSSAEMENKDIQMEVNMYPSPIPMKAEDKFYLVYEIFLQNYNKTAFKLRELTVSDSGTKNSSLAKFQSSELASNTRIIGEKSTEANKASHDLVLKPGTHAIIYMWVMFDKLWKIPHFLQHTITVSSEENGQEKTRTLTPKDLLVLGIPSVTVSPPLRGVDWVAVNGPSNSSIHRTTYRIGNGQIYFAQRYAIDFVKIGQNGNTYTGDPTKNQSYHAYGAPVYAVADAKVVKVQNDIPENKPGDDRAVVMNANTVGGNHIILDLGNNLYAFYAHMQPGSVKVRSGDLIKQGDLIGNVGNTGNSTEPHLHFHITDNPSFIYANGVPFNFNAFGITPSTTDTADQITVHRNSDQVRWLYNQTMLENALVQFESSTNAANR